MSTAAMSGLRGPVHSVFTEILGSGRNDQPISELVLYDTTGYDVEKYVYVRNALRAHTVYTRSDGRLLKIATTNPFSNETFVQLLNSDGAVAATETYNGNGVLLERRSNNAVLKSGTTISAKQTDGTVSTIEQFSDGSFTERTVRPDGTILLHLHGPAPSDTYQTLDANNRVLESVEDSQAGYTKTVFHYDAAGRETEIAGYNRSGRLVSENTIEYPHEDANHNWTEQVWTVKMNGEPAKVRQVTHRTFTYYGNARH